MFPGQGVEQRLSHLCYWALEYEHRREDYGLRLPGKELAPGRGERHLEQVLTALAPLDRWGLASKTKLYVPASIKKTRSADTAK